VLADLSTLVVNASVCLKSGQHRWLQNYSNHHCVVLLIAVSAAIAVNTAVSNRTSLQRNIHHSFVYQPTL
jgi:hypothetical protein